MSKLLVNTIAAQSGSSTTVSGSLSINNDLAVDGTANLDNTDIDVVCKISPAFEPNHDAVCIAELSWKYIDIIQLPPFLF